MPNDDDGKRSQKFWDWAALAVRGALIVVDWLLNRNGPNL